MVDGGERWRVEVADEVEAGVRGLGFWRGLALEQAGNTRKLTRVLSLKLSRRSAPVTCDDGRMSHCEVVGCEEARGRGEIDSRSFSYHHSKVGELFGVIERCWNGSSTVTGSGIGCGQAKARWEGGWLGVGEKLYIGLSEGRGGSGGGGERQVVDGVKLHFSINVP